MSITLKHIELPVACRWEAYIEVEHEGVIFEVVFLFDAEGVEDHTIQYLINGEEINLDKCPEAVSNYVETLSYEDLFK
jgi:hypothetical protein